MTTQRTYRYDEVREIFAAAARGEVAEPQPTTGAHGLSLADLQDIGREVGLDPVEVARAAAALDTRALAPPLRRTLGMPIEVTRIVPLSRAPTESEWEQLVAELRTAFRARGRVSSQGGLKEWVNGNLHACVEPSGTGYRLRLGTVKGNAYALNALGGSALVVGAISFGTVLLSGGVVQGLLVPWMMAASGAAAFAANFLRLPRWADERRRQMEHIAGKIGSIMETEPAAREADR
jgi:hypothetical protein